MATWGSGNFENETAIEYVRDQARIITEGIFIIFNDEVSLEPDEFESDILFCKIETLIWHLEKGKLLLNDVLDQKYGNIYKIVENRKTIYLEIWDNYVDELEPTLDYKSKRREIIKDTFNRLLKLVK